MPNPVPNKPPNWNDPRCTKHKDQPAPIVERTHKSEMSTEIIPSRSSLSQTDICVDILVEERLGNLETDLNEDGEDSEEERYKILRGTKSRKYTIFTSKIMRRQILQQCRHMSEEVPTLEAQKKSVTTQHDLLSDKSE